MATNATAASLAVGPPATGVDLMLLLSRASHALATELAAALAEVGVTPRAFCVLTKASAGELTQVQLAELAGLDKTTMVATVDELESAGLAQRRPTPTDRRARIVSVTPAGRRILVRGQRIVERVRAEVLTAIPAAEREVFLRGLARLVNGPLSAPVACEPAVRRRRAP